jgi:hypothetical protein
MTSRADNSRAAYNKYRKRKRIEEDNCNNESKRTKSHAERQREYRETHENVSAVNMRYYRKRKPQKNKTPQTSTSIEPTPTPIIYNYYQANEYFQKMLLAISLVMPATYVIDYGI